ncbi:lysine biosynthesis protein LysW [Candidatus Micrarchaeota archaeon]|nr:MAG: lysine biosynthesis protein LysW [Candidatus Micrarchaeota archaeon]
MADAECPECAGSVKLKEGAEQGEIISCPECGSRLEIVSVDPPKVQPAPKVDEDWGE